MSFAKAPPVGNLPREVDADLVLIHETQAYLAALRAGRPPNDRLRSAWARFYAVHDPLIHRFARGCNVPAAELNDCVQEVWKELVARLPQFRYDPKRGRFCTWLYALVRSKAVDASRTQHRRGAENLLDGTLERICGRESDLAAEYERQCTRQTVRDVLDELRGQVSPLSYQVLYLRWIEDRSVAEIAAALCLSPEQVWFRHHRMKRQFRRLFEANGRKRVAPVGPPESLRRGERKTLHFAQGTGDFCVSQSETIRPGTCSGERRVDRVWRRVELGRHGATPEWKVEWEGTPIPEPVLYRRTLSMVAYAELLAPEDLANRHWHDLVQSAITSGVAAGIATIVVTPTAALPAFEEAIARQLRTKIGERTSEITVALSARQEANGPWLKC